MAVRLSHVLGSWALVTLVEWHRDEPRRWLAVSSGVATGLWLIWYSYPASAPAVALSGPLLSAASLMLRPPHTWVRVLCGGLAATPWFVDGVRHLTAPYGTAGQTRAGVLSLALALGLLGWLGRSWPERVLSTAVSTALTAAVVVVSNAV